MKKFPIVKINEKDNEEILESLTLEMKLLVIE